MIPEFGITLFKSLPSPERFAQASQISSKSPNTNDQNDLFEILDFGPWGLFGI
jgi:hypothetical protein